LLLSVLGLSLLLGAIALPFSRVALSVMQPSAELHDN
jgi:multidrug resistance protein, MATE family